jgi:hypothetical protein
VGWTTLLLLSAALFAESAPAQRKISFQSKYDKFDLIMTGGSGEVNGKPADLSSIKDLLPLFKTKLPDTCPTFKRPPDLTVKDGDNVRTVYVDDGIVSDGKSCMTISGEGLFYFPVHRDFLIGPKTDGVKMKAPFKIFLQGKKLLELKKQGDTWVNDTPEMLVNWEFVDKLGDSLRQFDVRLRVQAGIGKDKQKIIFQNGGETLEFYKVTAVMWAMKKPGQPWLTASDEWSAWRDFEPSLYEDRYAGDIRGVAAAADATAKHAILGKIEAGWSRNLRDMYHRLALDEKEDITIRLLAVKRLKSKPSVDTAGVMVKILEESTSDELRDDAAVILKLNNPKGPKFKSSDPPEDRQKALDFWRSWWRQKQTAN